MKSGKIILILVGVIVLASIFLSRSSRHMDPSIQEKRFLLLSFEDFNNLIGGNDRMGAEQMKHMFERYTGRYVRWWGEVEEIVKEISGDYILRVNSGQAPEDLPVNVRLDKSKRQKLIALKRGKGVSYTGRLTDFDAQSGYYLDDGDIE